jgi:excisionase family DNA binding protein
MTQAQIDRYISTKQAAAILGVTHIRVQQLAQAGRLPHLRTPIGRLYPHDEIVALAAARNAQKGVKQAA